MMKKSADSNNHSSDLAAQRGARTPAGPRAAVYNRVSTAGQDPTTAMAELEAAARKRGLEIALAIAETGSGAKNNRPGLQRVLDAARRGKVSAVVVTRLDRFGRSSLDLLANIRALTDAGVEFLAVEQGLHVRPDGDAMSQLLLTVLSGVAEFERALIRERVQAGLAAAKKRGVRLGRPRTRPSADVVESLRAQGKSWKAISMELGAPIAACRRAVSK